MLKHLKKEALKKIKVIDRKTCHRESRINEIQVEKVEEMDTSELISVIVPVYNVEQYLKRCLDSLLKQSYENFEILLTHLK